MLTIPIMLVDQSSEWDLESIREQNQRTCKFNLADRAASTLLPLQQIRGFQAYLTTENPSGFPCPETDVVHYQEGAPAGDHKRETESYSVTQAGVQWYISAHRNLHLPGSSDSPASACQ
ncbi:hypothetical protein AAY473_016819, partial [Plecturocebus cupreus]